MKRRGVHRFISVFAVAGALGWGVSCGVSDVAVLEGAGDAGTSGDAPTINPPDAGPSCGTQGQPCCDGGCTADGSFCSVGNRCMSAHPTDVGAPCTSGATCQSGLCTNLQALDAGNGGHPPSLTVCSEPCGGATDCLAGWTCQSSSPQAVLGGTTALGTCLCAPVLETCDGKDDNCDGVIDEEPGTSAFCTQAYGVPSICVDAGCLCIETCGGVCVDLASDQSNCGTCGRTCGPGLVCSSSQCVCNGPSCSPLDGGDG